MNANILFIVLTFIVIIAVIITADNLTTAMIMISLLTNLLVISSYFRKISKLDGIAESIVSGEPEPIVEDNASTNIEDDQSSNIYGDDYNNWYAYKASYDNVPDNIVFPGSATASIDTMNIAQTQHRAKRANKSIEGAVSKDANFYKYHFASELDEAENKPWWSRNELWLYTA